MHAASELRIRVALRDPQGRVSGRQSVLRSVRRIARGAVLWVLCAACGADRASAPPETLPIYDMSAQFTQFSYETGVLGYPDCVPSGLYCHHVRSYTGGTMSGTIQYDRVGRGVTAELAGFICNAGAFDPAGGCSSMKDVLNAAYVPRSDQDASFAGLQVPVEFGRVLVFTHVVVTADSIYGSVKWSDSEGRDPPANSGSFVARER